MAQQYKDIYARDTLSDTGIWPSLQTFSCCSPDVITYKQKILTWKEASDNYGKSISCTVDNGTVNYCYVRGKNLAPDARTGSVYLYSTPRSLLLTPKKWTPVRTAEGKLSTPFICGEEITDIIPPQTVCINRNAFVFDLPPNGHFCFISFIETLYHPKVIPNDFENNLKLDAWVRENPSIAQLNVFTFDPIVNELTDTVEIGNENAYASNFVMVLSFTGINGGSFPQGLPIIVQSTDAMFPFVYNTTTPYKDSNNEQIVYMKISNVPGKYYGKLTVIIKNTAQEALSGTILYDYFECISSCTAAEEEYLMAPKYDMLSHDGQLIAKAGKKALLRLGSCAELSTDYPNVQAVYNRQLSYVL